MSEDMPSLSSAGFIKDPAAKLEKVFAYFFIADYSQSNQHRGTIASLPYLIKTHGHRPEDLSDQIENTLRIVLSSYFDTADVKVSIKDPLDDGPEYDIVVQGTVVEQGKTHGLAKLLSVSNNTLNKVSNFTVK